MQPDHESDELQTLLREEYAAPQLDKQFSADLITRLQAEVSSPQTPSLAPSKSRRSLLAICLGIAAIAASIIAVLLILNQKPQGTNREVARRVKSNSLLTHMELDTFSAAGENERLDRMSLTPRTMSLSESLSDKPESESKHYSESRVPRRENLVDEATREHLTEEERAPAALSQSRQLSVLATVALGKEWPNVSAAAALADRLYIVDSGRLYEINPTDGSRRSVGEDRWQNTSAMGAARGYLYLVCDNRLYEVDPKTEKRRGLGIPEWANTKAIVAVDDKLHIVSNGWLHRVNPGDGSYEVLHSKTENSKTESLNQSSPPKP